MRLCQGAFPGSRVWHSRLFRDLSALPYRDSNNEESVESAIAALSDFEQGALWMEDPAGEEFQEVGGRRVPGQVFAFPFRQRVSASMESVCMARCLGAGAVM